MNFKLSQRQERVLWATIRHYIATAEPVGSKVLVEEYDINASPATVRNAMGHLEKVGLLYQPHTSAGRVPSDSGYRVYVDRYITPSAKLARHATHLLNQQLTASSVTLELLIEGASRILATLSGCIAMIAMPQVQTTQIRHIQLVMVDSHRAMAIVVTDAYETYSTLVTLPVDAAEGDDLDPETIEQELHLLSNFLNYHLRDRTPLELAHTDWQALGREFDRYGDTLRSLLANLAIQVRSPATTRIAISGMAEVLRQPEFSELRQIQALVQLLEEEQDQLRSLIFSDPFSDPLDSTLAPASRLRVRIGSENPWEPIQGYTLISATYGGDSAPLGCVGVLGPTRMDYESTITVVEATADYLSSALAGSQGRSGTRGD